MDTNLRILLIGSIQARGNLSKGILSPEHKDFVGSTVWQRVNTLRELGHNVEVFPTDSYIAGGMRIMCSLQFRLGWGPRIWRLNSDLVSFSKSVDCDFVMVSKGVWITPKTIEQIKRNTGSPVVHYTADALILYNRSRHFIRSIPHYDAVITTKRFELESYKKLGAKKVIFSPKGYSPDLHKPVKLSAEEKSKYEADVTFIGAYEKYRSDVILAARDVCSDIAVWGRGWEKAAQKEPRLRTIIRGDGLWGNEYVKGICGAKIALGLLMKRFPETCTDRSIEIPACGTFLLAERTDEHRELFEEDKEIVLFSDFDELRDKIKYYLAHPAERRAVAAAGRTRCVKGGYSYKERLKTVIDRLRTEIL